MRSAEVIVVGAGIGGIAAAHELAVVRGVRDVVIVDDQPPLTVTSDKSTECYRDWWPQASMAALMGRSIERLEALAVETGNAEPVGPQCLSGTDRARSARCTAMASDTPSPHCPAPLARSLL